MDPINIKNKLSLFFDYWHPRIIGELNGQYVKIAKLKGEFVWHSHEHEDELFMVIKGRLMIRFKDRDVYLEEGEMLIVPAKVEHQPIAKEEVHVMLFEPKTTVNTGNIIEERTKTQLEQL